MNETIKLVCINTDGRLVDLTLYKIYESYYIDNIYYHLKGDDGFYCYYLSSRFITLSEWREKQIDLILSDE